MMRNFIDIITENEANFYYPDENAITESDLRSIFDGIYFIASRERPRNLGAALVNSLKDEDRIQYFNDIIVPIYQEHGLPRLGKPPYEAFQLDVERRWAANKKTDGVDYHDPKVVHDILWGL